VQSGTINVSVANGAATDLAGNPIVGASASQAYDTSAPTAVISLNDYALTTGESAIVTVRFSEKVTGFDRSDVSATSGTLGNFASTDGGVTWTATFTPTIREYDTSNKMTLATGSYTDLAGNLGAGAESANYTVKTGGLRFNPDSQTGNSLQKLGGFVIDGLESSATVTYSSTSTVAGVAVDSAGIIQVPGGFTGAATIQVTATQNSTTLAIKSFTITVGSNSGSDTLVLADNDGLAYGLGGSDNLSGGSGADYIFGGTAADTLTGNGGGDYLQGGAESDTFVYLRATDSEPGAGSFDTIADFNPREGDKIDLRGVDANSTTSSDDLFSWVGTAAFDGVGQLRFYTQAGKTIIQGNTDGDFSTVEFELHLIGTAYTSSDLASAIYL
jgi:Ca2+-binding RTX toxin-like protein